MNYPVISATTLWEKRSDKQLVVLYTRLADLRTGELEPIDRKVILNAQLFDFESTFADEQSSLPHTLCSASKFQHEARKLGINSDSEIVVYDSQGLYSAPRVWWMFKAMGHDNVKVLNGGVKAWVAANFPVSDTLYKNQTDGNFETEYDDSYFVSSDVISNILHQFPQHIVVDARSTGRFLGTQPEPRKGIRSGHIPSSIDLPFQSVVENGFLKEADQLETMFSDLLSGSSPHMYFSCGSGVTACVLALAAYSLGYEDIHVYDGSWTEWGGNPSLPIEQGS